MEKTPVYLIMVTSDNHNKFYNCEPNSDGTFTVKYGRVGGHESTKIYPMSKWDSQINSKLKKGYVSQTHLMTDVIENSKEEEPTEGKDKFSVIENKSVRDIIKRLYDFANKVVQSAYKVKSSVVTQAMIDEAQSLIDNLALNYENMDYNQFNKKLLEIFMVIPRKMSNVSDYLIYKNDLDSFKSIIDREQSTLDAMAGQVYKPVKIEKKNADSNTNNNEVSVLDEMGITMEDATAEDVVKIKKAMGDSADKFYRAWRVTNKATEEAYHKFVDANNIGNRKLLCHGSRNQNWFGILKMGLRWKLSNVITNGSMFGSKAIYFSNPDKFHGGVRKSIGYTSLGGYWTREQQNCGFLAFFEVALGDSYDAYQFSSQYYDMDLKKLKSLKPDAWHLWAHGNTSMLKNDELIVYSMEQMTIRYLVEIR